MDRGVPIYLKWHCMVSISKRPQCETEKVIVLCVKCNFAQPLRDGPFVAPTKCSDPFFNDPYVVPGRKMYLQLLGQ